MVSINTELVRTSHVLEVFLVVTSASYIKRVQDGESPTAYTLTAILDHYQSHPSHQD
jgi:hypothetical protein